MQQTGEMENAALLEAAAEAVLSFGLEAFTRREAARRSGLSVGTVNRLFPSRALLLRATLDWVLREIAAVEEQCQGTEPRERLESFFLVQEKLLLERRDLLRAWFTFVTHASLDRRLAARIQEAYVSRIEAVRIFLKETMSQNKMAPDLRPGLTAEDIVSSVEGMAMLWLNRTNREGISAHRRRAVRRWIKHLGLK